MCGQNSDCRSQLHRAVCICRDGYTGNAQSACFESKPPRLPTFPLLLIFLPVGCRANSDCAPTQTCVNRECVDPCTYTQCGLNALCRPDSNHRARCYCPDNFRGDAYIRCERPECMSDDECPFNLACRNERCEDPCNCGLHAVCTVNNHRALCSCPPGYVGNPLAACSIGKSRQLYGKPRLLSTVWFLERIEVPPQCRVDADCPSKQACFNNVCQNPCTVTEPCGVNAKCLVVDTLPLRTMSCLCLPGYAGDADRECKKGRLQNFLNHTTANDLLTLHFRFTLCSLNLNTCTNFQSCSLLTNSNMI